MIGQTLSHYKVLDEISRGGMGVVYRALDTKLDREVALKVLPPELVADEERRRRFIQEAKAAAALHHPHIATIFEIDEADGSTFIAMELIEGEKLGDLLQGKPLPLTRSLELAAEVAEALARAHDKGIVHRDLKPANIMVTVDGHAKVIDFGLAKLVEPLSTGDSAVDTALKQKTDSGVVMGTVAYMSPEQARGLKVDHRSDIFSFGIVLFEMLTGRLPFEGPSSVETLNAHHQGTGSLARREGRRRGAREERSQPGGPALSGERAGRVLSDHEGPALRASPREARLGESGERGRAGDADCRSRVALGGHRGSGVATARWCPCGSSA